MLVIVTLGLVGGCGHGPHASPSNTGASDEGMTLYRDGAKVRTAVVIKATGAAGQRITLVVPPTVDPGEAKLVVTGDLAVSAVDATPSDGLDAPSPVTFEIAAGKPGTYQATFEYTLPSLWWAAGYTLTTTPARTQVAMRGMIGLRNKLGTPLARVHVRLVDAYLSAASEYKGTPLDLGVRDIPTGESQISLLADDHARPLRSVMVFDPIGVRLDEATSRPNPDPQLGRNLTLSPTVTQSFEIARSSSSPSSLPSGTARLFERAADGQLVLLGEAEMFTTETREARVDTIAVGPADGVTGVRERRELSTDVDNHRVTEEIGITLTNKRPVPVEVIVREHLYRGLNWSIAYQSVPVAAKEGQQQISMRTTVPAHGQAKLIYVVVYTGL